MPVLGDPGHDKLISFLKAVPSSLNRPEAILVISAHWENTVPALNSNPAPSLYYDYGGFPPAAYSIDYPAPGAQKLSLWVEKHLLENGYDVALDYQRGFDHGMFIPLKLMYPDADIPCVQLSLLRSLDAAEHIALGKALAALAKENILVLGSGMSFHNLQSFFVDGLVSEEENLAFDQWLEYTCTSESLIQAEREQRLINWQKAPAAMANHPRPEHLLPLHVCFGIAALGEKPARRLFNDRVMNRSVAAYLWQ